MFGLERDARSMIKRLRQPTNEYPATPRSFVLDTSDACLVGENQTCAVPALKGCEGRGPVNYGHA